MALIASLVLFNISVWVGPAEVLAARGKAMLDSAPQHERAERFIMEGDIVSAATEYQALVEAEPDNASFRSEYGLLCFNNGKKLQHAFGWSREELQAIVVEQFKAARDLSPEDYSLATQYAMALMDAQFFGKELPVEIPIEAWENILTTVGTKQVLNSSWSMHDQVKSHTYLQLARIEFRYGRKAEMEKYIEQALAENPKLRIPKDLLEM
jgi:tetratricopeptide (TPR) repeat protein